MHFNSWILQSGATGIPDVAGAYFGAGKRLLSLRAFNLRKTSHRFDILALIQAERWLSEGAQIRNCPGAGRWSLASSSRHKRRRTHVLFRCPIVARALEPQVRNTQLIRR